MTSWSRCPLDDPATRKAGWGRHRACRFGRLPGPMRSPAPQPATDVGGRVVRGPPVVLPGAAIMMNPCVGTKTRVGAARRRRRRLHAMTRSDDGCGTRRWIRRRMPATGTCSTDDPTVPARPAVGPSSPTGCTRVAVVGGRAGPREIGRADRRGRGDLRACRRHLHSGARSTPPPTSWIPGRSRVDFRRTDAGELLFPVATAWGLRRRAVVQRARALRRPRRPGPARRRLPCAWFGGADRRGVQPLRPLGQLLGRGSARTFPRGATRGGEGVNIADADSDEVRRYIIGCALRWMRDFHADGLRLDAVHALVDTTAIDIPRGARHRDRLAVKPVGPAAVADRRKRLNDERLITPRDQHGYGLAAQWDDDIHHAIHTAVSGERQGYYADFARSPRWRRRCGTASSTPALIRRSGGAGMGGRLDTRKIPATRLLAYTCTHDQVGNRALGDRPSQNLSAGQLAIRRVGARIAPHRNAFMGEEWGASTPFQFFSSHPEPELARATARRTQSRVRRARLGCRRHSRPAGRRRHFSAPS